MKLSARTAQVAMLKGESLDRTPNAGVFDYKSSWGAGTLYVFAECKGPSSEYVCRLAIQTIGKEFKSSNRSLTAGLIAAINTAHSALATENRQNLRDHRATVGVTCAVKRDSELFVAQAGPAVAYALLGGEITRLPPESPRALPSWSTPLGGEDNVEVTLRHHTLQSGDTILMSSALLAAHSAEGELPELLAQGPEAVVDRLNRLLQNEQGFSALAVGFQVGSKRGIPPVRPAPKDLSVKQEKPPKQEKLPKPGRPSKPKEPPKPKENRASVFAIFPAAIDRVSSALSKVRIPSMPWRGLRRPPQSISTDVGNGPKQAKELPRANGRGEARGLVLTEEPKKPNTPAKSKIQEGDMAAVWSKGAGILVDKYRAPANGRQIRKLRLPMISLMLVMTTLLVYGMVTCVTRFTDTQSEARFDRIMNSATVTWERATNAGDLGQTRRLLNDADQLVEEAMSIRRNDFRARGLKQRIITDLAKLNALVKLPEAKVLTDLSKVEGGVKNLTDLVVEGEDAFILDRGNSKVYQFGIDLASGTLRIGKSTLVAKKGDRVGDKQVTDLVNILFMGAGGVRETSNLLIFDSARSLFEFTPGKGLSQLKVRGAQSWINPALALGFNSNLYILDPSASQVWRYFAVSSGYDSEMKGLLENADIRDAISFAIDRDIFILTRGGKLFRSTGGRLQEVDQDQLDKGLVDPNYIYTSPKTKFVYVLDAGNKRVVAFSKEGKYQRQLVGEALDDSPKSIYVDEARGKIYILAGQKLYMSSLPQ